MNTPLSSRKRLRMVKMTNGSFAACPRCKDVMAMGMGGRGYWWTCWRCGLEVLGDSRGKILEPIQEERAA